MELILERSALHTELERSDIPTALKQRNLLEFEKHLSDFGLKVLPSSPGLLRVDCRKSSIPAVLQACERAGVKAVNITADDVSAFVGESVPSRTVQTMLLKGLLSDSQCRKPEEIEPTIKAWIWNSSFEAPAAFDSEEIATRLRKAGFQVSDRQIDPVQEANPLMADITPAELARYREENIEPEPQESFDGIVEI